MQKEGHGDLIAMALPIYNLQSAICDPQGPALRQRLKRLAKRAARQLGGGLSRVLGSRAGTSLGILLYHRVTPCRGPGPAPTWNVPPARFRAQFDGLLALGYRPWLLRQALEHSRAGRPFPPKAFVVTFDDGYENVYRHAWPILRQRGVPATVFLPTAYLDQDAPFPFDDWPGAGCRDAPPESWRPLSAAQCAEMLAGGLIELGSHTHTHARFRGRPEALYRDVLASVAVLRARFGLAGVPFAFPFGVAGPVLSEAAKRAGVLCGLGTEDTLVRPGSDPFAWGRFGIEEADTAATIAARLDGWYGLARRAWRRLSRPLGEVTA
jgi:peptidoglycan/xylan/chitin deacetylase (PgdA/CDA1 family)